jgi:hypothetical protein
MLEMFRKKERNTPAAPVATSAAKGDAS